MILAVAIAAILAVAALAAIGYWMGPAPGKKTLTRRDIRLVAERNELASYRKVANPHLRTDQQAVVEGLSASAVYSAREAVATMPEMNETEALAMAIADLDTLERHATGVSLGKLTVQIAAFLDSVGVLNPVAAASPELSTLTIDDITADPGIAIRIVSVADLDAWPTHG